MWQLYLFSLSGSQPPSNELTYNQHLTLEPYSGPDITSSGDSALYGRLKWSRDNGSITTTTDYFPVYNGNYWISFCMCICIIYDNFSTIKIQ